MEKRDYFLKIAEIVFPELKAGKFFAKVNGKEHYFSGLVRKDVKIIYRSFYDEFDFAFSIHCAFSLCDQKTETRWKRKEGSEHFYSTPVLFVVDRMGMNYAPAQVVSRMQTHYRANALLLGSYAHDHFNELHLAEYLRRSRLHLIMQKELETEIEPPLYLLNSGSQIRRLDTEKKSISRKLLPLRH